MYIYAAFPLYTSTYHYQYTDLTYRAHTVPVHCKLDVTVTHVVLYLELYWCSIMYMYILLHLYCLLIFLII